VNEDEGFIRAIIAEPDDTSLRLIYADWLEERGDPRGEYLRIMCALAEMTEKNRSYKRQLRARLQKLREGIGPAWFARIDCTPIENCIMGGIVECPKRWEKLRETSDSCVRSCESCLFNVYHSSSIEEAQHNVRAGRCVAVDSQLIRRQGDLSNVRRRLRTPWPRRTQTPEPPQPTRRASRELQPGDRVTIGTGRWAGFQGVITNVRKQRRVVVGFPASTGRNKSVEVSVEDVELT
jgi:uncharacterized protein (TIGR02996 family)